MQQRENETLQDRKEEKSRKDKMNDPDERTAESHTHRLKQLAEREQRRNTNPEVDKTKLHGNPMDLPTKEAESAADGYAFAQEEMLRKMKMNKLHNSSY